MTEYETEMLARAERIAVALEALATGAGEVLAMAPAISAALGTMGAILTNAFSASGAIKSTMVAP